MFGQPALVRNTPLLLYESPQRHLVNRHQQPSDEYALCTCTYTYTQPYISEATEKVQTSSWHVDIAGNKRLQTRKDIQQSLRDFFVLCPSSFRSFQFFTLLIFEKVRAALLHISRLREIPSAAMEKLLTFPIKIFSNYYRYGCTLTMS